LIDQPQNLKNTKKSPTISKNQRLLKFLRIFPAPFAYFFLPSLSDGFSIWKLHNKDSSTLIIAPELSNSPQ